MDRLTDHPVFQSASSYIVRIVGIFFCLVYFGIESLMIYSLYHNLLPYYRSNENYSTIAQVRIPFSSSSC